MNEFKGTPGPWFNVKNMAGHQTIRITQRNGQQKTLFISLEDENADDNARLIAAAPDLLDALQELINFMNEKPGHLTREYLKLKSELAITKALKS